jgi:hypothetical protein
MKRLAYSKVLEILLSFKPILAPIVTEFTDDIHLHIFYPELTPKVKVIDDELHTEIYYLLRLPSEYNTQELQLLIKLLD